MRTESILVTNLTQSAVLVKLGDKTEAVAAEATASPFKYPSKGIIELRVPGSISHDAGTDENGDQWLLGKLKTSRAFRVMGLKERGSRKAVMGLPFKAYISQKSKGVCSLLILPARDMSSFLKDMPDSMPLSTIVLPGTHQSLSLYWFPFSQCQSRRCTLYHQLHMGIRFFDVRLSVIGSELIAAHGILSQHLPFADALDTIASFLSSHPSETMVMSIKQEDFETVPGLTFSALVKQYVYKEKSMWWLANRIPNLGEARGKVVLFSRFGGDGFGWDDGTEGMGIKPTIWPDNRKDGFEWYCKDTRVVTHDWYGIPSFLSIPEKFASASAILRVPLEPQNEDLPITFFSASSFPFAFPPVVARGFGWPRYRLGMEGVNSRVGRWLAEVLTAEGSEKDAHGAGGEKIRGWVLMDYFDEPEGITPLLVECNYRWRGK
ncbi:hypothetical protein BOTBODRAFT_161818 [Botryobasidium botryosum FD-172 SS1]|uniref:Phosphatidylinositol-specific phospholipase C X domain-containing protein n=1 Tax=Botryobasidium botryosum (strain FD-172 SS1) TaxID=930990 RepID=A0A067MC71_BOTB1|nr:hypothetical protein BOTBODRAFT_161818 [Botryobasidium botryosum FD-172 SS1]